MATGDRGAAGDDERAGAPARRLLRVLDVLAAAMPDARIALDFTDPWELLVATMLSAQSTDVRVNEVTRVLFRELPGPAAVAGASVETLEGHLATLGLFRTKARNLRATAALVLERHGGQVPDTMEALVALPGVARKTANVVLSNAFGRHEGVVVDTHVARVARRLGLTQQRDPVRIERDLVALVPPQRRLAVSDLLIHHGRRVCHARRPDCGACPIERLCPSSALAGLPDLR
jgi:endonuclease III